MSKFVFIFQKQETLWWNAWLLSFPCDGFLNFFYSLFITGYVKLPPEKFAQKKQGEASKDLPTEPKKLQLNSAEELYAEIRDKNFNAVGAALSKKAKIISAAFEVSHALVFFLS